MSKAYCFPFIIASDDATDEDGHLKLRPPSIKFSRSLFHCTTQLFVQFSLHFSDGGALP